MTSFAHRGPDGGIIEIIPGYAHAPTATNPHAQRMNQMILGFNDGTRRILNMNPNGSMSMVDAITREALPLDRRTLDAASSVFRNTQFVAQQLTDHPTVNPSTFGFFDAAIGRALRTLSPTGPAR